MSAAFAAMVATAAPGAFAQNPPQPVHPSTAAPVALTVLPNQIRAAKFIGSTVYDVQNRNIGSVKDMILDRNGEVSAVIVDVGSFLGMGGKYVAVALSDIKTDHDRLTLDRSKEQLQAAQAFQLDTSKAVKQ